jgi:ribonuclease VapC
MIAVDTSALMAIVLREPRAFDCARAMRIDDELLISAGTVTEALIVSARRGVGTKMEHLIHDVGFEIVSVTSIVAERAAEAYRRWGKGLHPAALNFGDCFAYEVAKQNSCRLLYLGDDFSKTDIESVL